MNELDRAARYRRAIADALLHYTIGDATEWQEARGEATSAEGPVYVDWWYVAGCMAQALRAALEDEQDDDGQEQEADG